MPKPAGDLHRAQSLAPPQTHDLFDHRPGAHLRERRTWRTLGGQWVQPTTWTTAAQATRHCLTGCAAGEVAGMVLAAAFGWGNGTTIVASLLLAFAFGYALTVRGVLRAGVAFGSAVRVAFASDTVSIATMEVVDDGFIDLIPGALAAGLGTFLFWWTLVLSLGIAFLVA